MIQVKHPILFLDVDGVLNSAAYIKYIHAKRKNQENPLDPMCVDRLQTIVNKTDAQIVVTSAWRLYPDDIAALMLFFKDYCIPVIGMTDSSKSGRREEEIAKWLKKHFVIHDCFVILDDDSWDLHIYDDHLVKTKNEVGLTAENTEKCLELFAKFRPSLDSVVNLNSLEWLDIFTKQTAQKLRKST